MITNKIHISSIIDARRMDPIYFRYGTERFGLNYPLATIGSISYDIQSGFGAGKGDQATQEDGILHLRPTNINNEGVLIFDKNVYVPSSLNKPILAKGDVLFNNTNSQELVGKTAMYDSDKAIFFSNHITRIRVNTELVIAEYLWIMLNKYQREKIFFSICTNWNNQSGVGMELLKSIKIPLPSMQTQKKIVEIYTKAQSQKQSMEREAKELLTSIDSYLLEQLGISIPEALGKQLGFKTNISAMIGNRYDVSFYKDRFELHSSKYPNHRLSEIVTINPSVSYKSLSKDDEITFIPMEVVDEKFGEVAESRVTTVAGTKGFTKFEEGDLLWAKITPCMQNGKSAIAKGLVNGVGCGSTEFYVIRPKTADVSIEYIYSLLRHHKVLEAAKSSFGGSAGQQRVSSSYLKSISTPLPPIEVQNKIVHTIVSKKAKAKQLQHDGAALLESAKQKIETMILG